MPLNVQWVTNPERSEGFGGGRMAEAVTQVLAAVDKMVSLRSRLKTLAVAGI